MKGSLLAVVTAVCALLVCAPGVARAQSLVIQGGTLIDGTGSPPVPNAVIVIQNGRFAAVGRAGEVAIPSGAQVIDVAGKTILPGFLDGHCHWEDFYGELYLHLGVTGCFTIEIDQDGPWEKAQREGTRLGKIRGPRIWTSGRAIGGPRTDTEAQGSRGGRGNIIVHTPEEARAAVDAKKADGYDMIKVNEFLTMDLVKVVTDEAHKLGFGVTSHSWNVIGSANSGTDSIEHIWSVGYSSIQDGPWRRKLAEDRLAGRIDQELAGALYDTANYDQIINAMVSHHVAWTPTVAKWLRPLAKDADRFRKAEDAILNDPDADLPPVLTAVTHFAYDKLLKRYTPEQLAQAKVGYEKAKEFIRRFVAAGGILKEGSDPPRGMAAMLIHEALAIDVEAGVPPLIAIKAATLVPARVFKKDKDYGSVEPGKVADLSIVEGDPMQDIWATQNVKMVVMDGKLVDTGFHRYKNPIPQAYSYQTMPREIAIAPVLVTQGTGPIVLKVKGKGMWPYHVVLLNGKKLDTHYVSRNEIDATIPPDAIADVGTYRVTVKSPGEDFDESYPAHLTVGFKP